MMDQKFSTIIISNVKDNEQAENELFTGNKENFLGRNKENEQSDGKEFRQRNSYTGESFVMYY